MNKLIYVLLCCFTCSSNNHQQEYPFGTIVPGQAPDPDNIDDSICKSACEKLHELNCNQSLPIETIQGSKCEYGINKQGCTSCEQFCVDTSKHGIYLDMPCIAKLTAQSVTAPYCPEVEACAIATIRE